MTPASAAERRAAALLRCYPPAWRARYGEEFAELLAADLAERPRCWRRTADVLCRAMSARLAGAGLADHPLDPAASARAGLATAASALAAALVVGAAIWSQLTIGWQWAPPASPATALAMGVMSAAMGLLGVLGLLAGLPIAWSAAAAARRHAGRRLRAPALLLAAGAVTLAVGAHHFQNGWPGTGARWWPQQHLVPGGVAAFAWAATLAVTSYWAHPTALAAFPAAEIVWMALSPAAIAALVAGTAGLVRRVELSPRAARWEQWLGWTATVVATAFLAAALVWLTEGGPGPAGLFQAGVIDVAGAAVMLAALTVTWQALRRARPPDPAAGS